VLLDFVPDPIAILNTWYNDTQTLPFSLQDGSDFRRARLRADGTFDQWIDFAAEVNFATIQDVSNADTQTQIGSVGLSDFWVTFTQVPIAGNVRVGHLMPPIGLENLTSSNVSYYMERSPSFDAFINPFVYASGVMAFDSYLEDHLTAAVSLTRIGKQTMNPFGFGSGPGEYAATGRLTGLPIYEDDGRRLLHLGIGYSLNGLDNHQFQLANRPLVRAGAGSQEVPNIIQTGTFFTPDPAQTLNSELAVVLGRLSLSAEYQVAWTTSLFDQFSGGTFAGPHGNATYQRVYAEVGFFLDPRDNRHYNRKEGVWDRQVTQRGLHLVGDHMPVQLICRYSYLDLASGNPVLTPASGAQAGWENDLTAGVNWFINAQVCFSVNYVYTHLQYVNDTSGSINGLGCRLDAGPA
jgi:phosphate-selective porin OprO/OprP